MVVTSAPSHWVARIVQLFTDVPSICTTQAPHWLVSQPTWVPVRPRRSRRSCTSSVRASTSDETGLPFTVLETVGLGDSLVRSRAAARPGRLYGNGSNGGSLCRQSHRGQARSALPDVLPGVL